MKRYLIWAIVLGVLGVLGFCLSIASLSEGNYVYSVSMLFISLADGCMAWDAFSKYKNK